MILKDKLTKMLNMISAKNNKVNNREQKEKVSKVNIVNREIIDKVSLTMKITNLMKQVKLLVTNNSNNNKIMIYKIKISQKKKYKEKTLLEKLLQSRDQKI